MHKTESEAAGQHTVDKNSSQHADAGIKNAVQGVEDISISGGVEQQDMQSSLKS